MTALHIPTNQGGETEQIISVICHVTKHKYYLLLYLTMLNLKMAYQYSFP